MKKPSVTELLNILNKPALLNWANKIGLEGIDLNTYRSKSQLGGTNIHNQIENCIKNGEPLENIENQVAFDLFFKDVEVLDSEVSIESDFFVGRVDIRYQKNNKIYLCDFKSNHKKNYLENVLQVCAYSLVLPCDELGIISIPDFKYFPISSKNIQHSKVIIESLYNIYTNKNKIIC